MKTSKSGYWHGNYIINTPFNSEHVNKELAKKNVEKNIIFDIESSNEKWKKES